MSPPLKQRPLFDFRSMLITIPIALIGGLTLLFVAIAPINWGPV
jgi:hypothetical protein